MLNSNHNIYKIYNKYDENEQFNIIMTKKKNIELLTISGSCIKTRENLIKSEEWKFSTKRFWSRAVEVE